MNSLARKVKAFLRPFKNPIGYFQKYPERLFWSAVFIAGLLIAGSALALGFSLTGFGYLLLGLAVLYLLVLAGFLFQNRFIVWANLPTRRENRLAKSYYYRYSFTGTDRLVATLQSTNTKGGAEILIYSVFYEKLSAKQFYDFFSGSNKTVKELAALSSGANPKSFLKLAGYFFTTASTEAEHQLAVKLYEVAEQLGILDSKSIQISDQLNYLEALISTKKWQAANKLLRALPQSNETVKLLKADPINPYLNSENGDYEHWLDTINQHFQVAGLEPISLLDGTDEPFDRISAESTTKLEASEKVTVIVTSYRPNQGLFTSVNSILQQSWQNLEILVIDDASGEEFKAIYNQLEKLDSRIKVHYLPENGGTYLARNFGLKVATGEFVAFQDNDDWMHPRRIELQLEQLKANPDELANLSLMIRVTPKLGFSHSRNPVIRLAEISIVFRREAVLSEFGFFAPVRKGGDSEFRYRIEARQQRKLTVVPNAVLTLARMQEGSLSAADISRSQIHPARRFFRDNYRIWHKQNLGVAKGLYLSGETGDQETKFQAPARIKGFRPQNSYSLVLAQHWYQTPAAESKALKLEQIEKAIRSANPKPGTIAISQLSSVWIGNGTKNLAVTQLVPKLINERLVDYLDLDESVEVEKLVILNPDSLQFAGDLSSNFRVSELIICSDLAEVDSETGLIRYDKSEVSKAAERIFGVTPNWQSLKSILKGLESITL